MTDLTITFSLDSNSVTISWSDAGNAMAMISNLAYSIAYNTSVPTTNDDVILLNTTSVVAMASEIGGGGNSMSFSYVVSGGESLQSGVRVTVQVQAQVGMETGPAATLSVDVGGGKDSVFILSSSSSSSSLSHMLSPPIFSPLPPSFPPSLPSPPPLSLSSPSTKN